MGICLSHDSDCKPFPKAIEHSNNLSIDKVYKLQKKIGGGAFGTVWLSHRKDYPKYKFAIKKINKKEVGFNELEFLKREIDVLREVDHPNIIKFYDTYENSTHLFIVMEYCSGGELFQKITTEKCLHESEARVYMNKMIMAVNHLHSLNIVHRDLKTENFLFDSKCATKELKLVDFGLSNKFGKNFSELHSQVGTIYYVAPEVLKGSYDYKCDMWSLGVLMYTMLSGDLPFYDDNLSEVYKKLNSCSFTFDKPIWQGISATAKDLISHLLILSPTDRYSASEALKHNWFTSIRKRTSMLTKSVCDSLKSYQTQTIFQRETLRVMVKHIPEEKIESLKEIFLSLDLSGNGFICVDDLEKSLKDFEGIDEELVKGIIGCLDAQGTGNIYYSDFIGAALLAKKDLMEEALWITFKQFDINNSGELSGESIQRAIESIGRTASSEEIQSILETVKTSGGIISFERFKELILGKSDN